MSALGWSRFQRWRPAFTVLAILAVLCATRIPLAPKYLYYFDSVNFSLALREFNPALHQPQPPGYPLQVLFIRMIHVFLPKAEHVLIAAGILTSLLAVVLVGRLGSAMFSKRAGFAAALLLLLHPVFWYAGLSNQVRLWLAAGAAAVVLGCWRTLMAPEPAKPFVGACLLLGVLSGFRPAMLLFLLPLLGYTAWRSRPGWRALSGGGLILAVAVAAWLGYTVASAGGWGAYLGLLRGYAADEFSATSSVFGAPARSAWEMFRAAAVWNLLGVGSWIWALVVVRPRWDSRGPVFLLWLVPAFLFHAVIHVGDPDHTLINIAGLCLLGGAAFDRLGERLTREGFVITNALGVTLNALLFFLPLPGLPGATTFRAVEYVDRQTRDTFAAIGALAKAGPIAIVCYNSFVTYRHVGYYYPEHPLLVLRQPYKGEIGPEAVWLFHRERLQPVETRDGGVVMPAARRVVWLLGPHDGAARADLARAVDLRQEGPVYWSPLEKAGVRFGNYHLIPGPAEGGGSCDEARAGAEERGCGVAALE